MRKDDSSLSQPDLDEVKRHALRLLREAAALGRYPTPVDDLLRAARLKVVGDIGSTSLIRDFLSNVGASMAKRARPIVSEVKGLLGMLHVPTGEILLDSKQHKQKQIWIKLHETGHGYLPHQREMYSLLEEGQYELNPDVEDLFEREANNFAAEAIFQLDAYAKVAADYVTSIKVPMDLSKKFGASIYASMRRYATTHHRPLAMAVYEFSDPVGFTLRRAPFYSESYLKRFGPFAWPTPCPQNHWLWSHLVSGKLQENTMTLTVNGSTGPWGVHVFDSTYQKFVLLFPAEKSIFSRIAA